MALAGSSSKKAKPIALHWISLNWAYSQAVA
jgi:hypothetical protein